MRILLTGANGFIGSQVASALTRAGHKVVAGVRRQYKTVGNCQEAISCDFTRDTSVRDWLIKLEGIEAVVNCAGILREGKRGTFQQVHVDAPLALFQACEQGGIKKVVQISAIGNPDDSEFIRSKHYADLQLKKMNLDWTIIRPSVVYSMRGSYGGTSLIRAMAALPLVLFIPGDGRQPLQPVCGEDLGNIISKVLEHDSAGKQVIEAVGPEPITFKHYLSVLRKWLGVKKPALVFHVPLYLIKPVALLGEWFGNGPLGLTMYRMLQRGNVASEGGYEKLKQLTGVATASVDTVMQQAPAFVQDRWHARLYFIRPLLRIVIGLLWVASGIVGFTLPVSESQAVMSALGLPDNTIATVIYSMSTLDIVLGLMVLGRIGLNFAAVLMLISVVAYTLIIGIFFPSAWLEPFGGLIKNIPLIPAILVMMSIEDIR